MTNTPSPTDEDRTDALKELYEMLSEEATEEKDRDLRRDWEK